jgi:hypothetical protein
MRIELNRLINDNMEDLVRELERLKTDLTQQIKKGHLDISLAKFKGREDNRSFEEFLKAYCRLGDSLEWDDQALLKNVPQLLSGEALASYDLLTDNEKDTWGHVKTALNNKFEDTDSESLARFQLLSRKQKSCESMAEFGQAISQLVKKGYSTAKGYNENQRNSLSVDAFLNGVRKEIKEQIIRQTKPDNIAEAISKAQKEELIQKSLNPHDDAAELRRAVGRLEEEIKGEIGKLKKECKEEINALYGPKQDQKQSELQVYTPQFNKKYNNNPRYSKHNWKNNQNGHQNNFNRPKWKNNKFWKPNPNFQPMYFGYNQYQNPNNQYTWPQNFHQNQQFQIPYHQEIQALPSSSHPGQSYQNYNNHQNYENYNNQYNKDEQGHRISSVSKKASFPYLIGIVALCLFVIPSCTDAFWIFSSPAAEIEQATKTFHNKTMEIIKAGNEWANHVRETGNKIEQITENKIKQTIGTVKGKIENAKNELKQEFTQTVEKVHEKIEQVESSLKEFAIWLWFWFKVSLAVLLILFLLGACGTGYYYYKKFSFFIFGLNKATSKAIEMTTKPQTSRYLSHHVSAIDKINAVLPFVHAKIDGSNIVALFDSGASLSLIRMSMAEKLGLKIEANSNLPVAHAANGTDMKFLGEAKATLMMGEFSATVNFLIVEDGSCPSQVLIGTDTIELMNKQGFETTVNIASRTVKIGNNVTKFVASISEEDKLTNYPELVDEKKGNHTQMQ